jgi:hypothetical protein
VDETSKDPSFAEFRKKLIRAAEMRDLEFVLSILDPEIKNSFGGDDGIEGFKRIWEPEKPDTALWPTLLKVLSMGGSYYRSGSELGFSAPYVHSRWPGEFDPFEYVAITGKNINLRREAGAEATVVERLSYDIVKLEGSPSGASEFDYGATSAWVRVKTHDGKIGYVSSRFVYSPIDYRVWFVKQNGEWRMKGFVAGD